MNAKKILNADAYPLLREKVLTLYQIYRDIPDSKLSSISDLELAKFLSNNSFEARELQMVKIEF